MKKVFLFSVTLDDCDVTHYKGSGAGGQKRNKTSSATRIQHRDSGACGQCESYREQPKNKAEAFKRMINTEKFKVWFKVESARVTGKLALIDEKINREMKEVKVEIKNSEGRWVDEKS